jgi:hypothetical protein
MVRDNPFLGPDWVPLAVALAYLIGPAEGSGRKFLFQTYGHRYSVSPDQSPYVQMLFKTDGTTLVELSANLVSNPELTVEELAMLEFYGWTPPEVEPDDYRAGSGGNPNFSREFAPGSDYINLIEFVLMSLVSVYAITLNDFWGFPEPLDANFVAAQNLLGRLKYSKSNPMQVIFATPGFHTDMLEGVKNEQLS